MKISRVAIVAVAGLMLVPTLALATSESPVLTSRQNEFLPSRGDGFLAWSQNSRRHPRHYDTYARRDGRSPFKVNPAGSVGWSGGIDGTSLIEQVVTHRGDQSDLELFDLVSRTQSNPPAGIDTRIWEWKPSTSGDQILFGRNNINIGRHEFQAVILFDTTTGRSRILALVRRNAAFTDLQPGQVNGDWATWERCLPGIRHCNVFLYQISTRTTSMLPNPSLQQYNGGVTADGTVYYVRTGQHDRWKCGASSKIVRQPAAGSSTVIANLPKGKDSFALFAYTEPDGSTTLFFDQVSCSTGRWDVFKILDADTATGLAPAARVPGGGPGTAPTGIAGPTRPSYSSRAG